MIRRRSFVIRCYQAGHFITAKCLNAQTYVVNNLKPFFAHILITESFPE